MSPFTTPSQHDLEVQVNVIDNKRYIDQEERSKIAFVHDDMSIYGVNLNESTKKKKKKNPGTTKQIQQGCRIKH